MKGMGWLLGLLVRIDQSGGAPPYPAQVFNPATLQWENIATGGTGGGAGGASSPLVRAHRPIGVLGDYVCTTSGELVVTADGESVTLGALHVYEVPEFVLTAKGDVIGVVGR